MYFKTSFEYNLFQIVTLIIFSNVLGAEEGIMACLDLFNPEYLEKKCCNLMENADETAILECKKGKDLKNWTCEDSKCVLNYYGILDGEEINEDKAIDQLKITLGDAEEQDAIMDRLEKNCLNGKYAEHLGDAGDEICDAMKFDACVFLSSIVECNSFKTEDPSCAKFADSVKKCKATIDYIPS